MPTNSSRGGVAARGLGAALLLSASLFAAACSSNSDQPDGGTVCRQGFPDCDGGTQCTNGICEPTCGSVDGGCPAGDYCEDPTAPLNICSPIQVTVCATDNDCPAPQTCAAGGICSVVELQANGSSQGCLIGQLDDKCAPDSVCYQIPNGEVYLNYCVGLAHCSEDGGCPNSSTNPGSGAVCNQLADGGYLFPGKERLCLFGYCIEDSNCPTGTACFHRDPTQLLGQCQDGLPGDPCYTVNDCFNSSNGCEAILDGGFDGGQDDGGSLGQCY